MVYIVSIWNFPTAITSYYCRKYKKPYIISPRGHLYPSTYGKRYWKKVPYFYLIAKRDLQWALAIHYTTEDEAEQCHGVLGLEKRAIVIPNGVDLSEFEHLPKKESLRQHYPVLKNKKVILFLGRINWKKGLDLLIKAYSQLTKDRDDIHLLIVGNDENGYGEKVKKWIKDYGMNYKDYGLRDNPAEVVKSTLHPNTVILPYRAGRAGGLGVRDKVGRVEGKEQRVENVERDIKVTFTGMLTGEDKLEAFTGSDIFVLPSYSENFGMAVLEAMACGLPVAISNKVGIYREVNKKRAGIVVECNSGSLYQGIKTILDNETFANKLSINGRKLVEEYYDIDKVADRMMEIYKGVIDGLY